MKLMILGHAGHGKDTAATMLAELTSLTFKSSSMHCLEKIVYPALKDKYEYKTKEQCFDDRINHRVEWFELIKAYNKDEPARLVNEIFKESDMYVGLRNKDELDAATYVPAYIKIWIDASKRLPPEPDSSMTITKDDADIIIENNGTEQELFHKLYMLTVMPRNTLISASDLFKD